MDITKVKVFDEINKVMRYDVAAIDFELNRVYFINKENRIDRIERREFWDAPFKVIHPTGLTDRNGKEIYEGDIMPVNGFNYVVTYNEEYARYCLQTETGRMFIPSKNCEVIGNIYEHPHLLEGVK